jgi:TolB-like protein/Flp pilus assembly protein TadD
MAAAGNREIVCFDRFELDPGTYQLRRSGRRVRLERQPMELLILLIERRPDLVTRTDIVARLWDENVFVDVDTAINTAVRKIRQALNDSDFRFVETVSGKGYRFVAQVETVPPDTAPMLAVLPFINLTNDEDRDYLTDGLTEDTIAALSQIDPARLHVIGRRSALAYKGSKKSIARIGRELNAQYIVEGSLRAVGDQLQVRSTLNRVRDQVQLWTGTFAGPLAAPPHLLQQVSSTTAQEVRARVSPEAPVSTARRHSASVAAYDLYLRGRRLWNQLTPATTRAAVDCYKRATEIDSGYALAWAGIAEACASAPINADAEPHAMWPPARDAAARALEANPRLSEAHHVLGQVNWFFEWDFHAAECAFREAIALDSSNAWSHSMLGHVLSQLGRHDEAARQLERASVLEPLSALHHAMWSQVAFQARDFRAAESCARRAIVIDPEFWVGYMMLGQACEQRGDSKAALDALTTATRLSGNSKPLALRAYLLGRSGDTQAACDVLDMLGDLAPKKYVPPYAQAVIYAGLNDPARMFEHLERAWAVRDVHLVFLTVDPKWDAYRADERFAALLRRCGFSMTAPLSDPDAAVET